MGQQLFQIVKEAKRYRRVRVLSELLKPWVNLM
jgi:hypothetical protein